MNKLEKIKNHLEKLKKKTEKELVELLDTALSAHHYMLELLDEELGTLSEKDYGLIGKIHDKYERWKNKNNKKGKKWSKNFGKIVDKNIRNLGVQKGLMQFCDKPTDTQKKYEKHLIKMEKVFVKKNKETVLKLNDEYWTTYKNLSKEAKKKEKNFIELFESIKRIYNEYKKKIGKQSGIFKSKDPKNPNKYRDDYEGNVVTDFMEEYIENTDEYLKAVSASLHLDIDSKVISILEDYSDEIIYGVPDERFLHPEDLKIDDDERKDDDNYDLGAMQDEEFRPPSPTYDPFAPESSDDEFPYLPHQYVVQHINPHQGLLTPDGEYSGEEIPSSVESSYNSSHESDEDFYDAPQTGGKRKKKTRKKKRKKTRRKKKRRKKTRRKRKKRTKKKGLK